MNRVMIHMMRASADRMHPMFFAKTTWRSRNRYAEASLFLYTGHSRVNIIGERIGEGKTWLDKLHLLNDELARVC